MVQYIFYSPATTVIRVLIFFHPVLTRRSILDEMGKLLHNGRNFETVVTDETAFFWHEARHQSTIELNFFLPTMACDVCSRSYYECLGRLLDFSYRVGSKRRESEFKI
jgi:hypothetical protein